MARKSKDAGNVTTDDALEDAPLISGGSDKLTLSNPTGSTRGLMLPKGVLLLQPGEVRVIPDEHVDEVKKLLRTNALQAIVDSGVLRVSGHRVGEKDVKQPTPTPPSELTGTTQVPGTGLQVGANASASYNPTSSNKLAAAGSMTL